MNYPPTDNLQPPDPEEVDRHVRDRFKDGDIKKTSQYIRDAYSTLLKRLNPNDPTESVAYEFLMFLYGAEMAREGLGEEVWAVVSRLRPRRVNRCASANSLKAAYYNLEKVLAEREDGHRTPEEVEDAKNRLAEAVANVGAGCRVIGAGLREQQP